jgi:hypothetical protein
LSTPGRKSKDGGILHVKQLVLKLKLDLQELTDKINFDVQQEQFSSKFYSSKDPSYKIMLSIAVLIKYHPAICFSTNMIKLNILTRKKTSFTKSEFIIILNNIQLSDTKVVSQEQSEYDFYME